MVHDDHVRCSTVYRYVLNINIHDVPSAKIYNRLFDTIIVFTIMFQKTKYAYYILFIVFDRNI